MAAEAAVAVLVGVILAVGLVEAVTATIATTPPPSLPP